MMVSCSVEEVPLAGRTIVGLVFCLVKEIFRFGSRSNLATVSFCGFNEVGFWRMNLSGWGDLDGFRTNKA